jgi:glutamate-ammonia-ligase adenylyltransferase
MSLRHTVGALSELADEIVQDHFLAAAEHLPAQIPLAVVALGKYGGCEITVGSDLDLVILYRNVDDTTPTLVEEFARRFNASFSVAGDQLYHVDMRLRPEGHNAPLGVEMEYFRTYLQQRASLWERQSLVKARIICESGGLADKLAAILEEATYRTSLPKQWVREIRRMRLKVERERSKGNLVGEDLKVGRGGLADVEFAVQTLQLKFGKSHSAVRERNTFEAIQALQKAAVLSREDARVLLSNVEFLRAFETIVRMNSERNEFVLPRDPLALRMVAAALGEHSVQSCLQRLRTVRKQNRIFMQEAFRLCQER